MQKHFRPTADKVIDNYEQIIGTELTKPRDARLR